MLHPDADGEDGVASPGTGAEQLSSMPTHVTLPTVQTHVLNAPTLPPTMPAANLEAFRTSQHCIIGGFMIGDTSIRVSGAIKCCLHCLKHGGENVCAC